MSDTPTLSTSRLVEPGGTWARDIRTRLAALTLDPAREEEIVEELSQHLDEEYRAHRQAGVSDEAARRMVVAELLGPEALAGYMRSLRQAHVPSLVIPGAPRKSFVRDLGEDLRGAFRMLLRHPGFAAGAILTLALGIGVNSAMFALVDAYLLRPLPLPSPERTVVVTERTVDSAGERVSPNNFLDWRLRSRSFEALGAYLPNVGGMVIAGADGTAETISRQWVTAGFFEALGVTPVTGRFIQVADDREGSEAVVLSESFWRRRFGGDPTLIGRELRLDGDLHRVLGVAPDSVHLMGQTDVWAMVKIADAPPRARGAHVFSVVARLKPDTTMTTAAADLSIVAETLAREYPETNAGRSVTLSPLDTVVIGADLRQTSLLFVGVVVFVLLVCCANVANLLLARATARARELAVRAAIGADRSRLIRQLLVESLALAILGGVLGLAMGAAILRVAPALIPDGLLPSAVTLSFDVRVVAFCGAAAVFVGLLCGIAPALQATAVSSAQALAVDSRTTVGGGGRMRDMLVAAEVATAVLLLVGAGLLLRTLLLVQDFDRGYRAESALTMVVDPLGSRYPTTSELTQFYEAVDREVSALPGVKSVAWASTLPLGSSYAGAAPVTIVGDPPPAAGRVPSADYQVVSPSYFQTLDLPMVAGRAFDSRDTRDGAQVCIVNEAFVHTHLGGREPIGMRVSIQTERDRPPEVREIVGVARQIKARPDETTAFQQVYVPLAQAALSDMFIIVRPVTGRASVLGSSVRSAIGRVDKEQLVSVRNVATLEDVAWETTARYRFRAVLVVAFAALALLLAMVGLFGVLAYSVERRGRDLGVRRVLGATTRDVVRSVVGGAVRVLVLGAVAGVVLAVALGRLLASMLFGVAPLDLLTFVLVLAVLSLTAAAAMTAPTWRAVRVNPAVALRSE